MAWSDVILHAKLILFFTDHAAAEPLAEKVPRNPGWKSLT